MSTRTRRPKQVEPLSKLEVAKVAAEPNPLPDWVTETPLDCSYTLAMIGNDGAEQEIELTRAEYIWLKCALADMEGYKVPDSAWKEGAA